MKTLATLGLAALLGYISHSQIAQPSTKREAIIDPVQQAVKEGTEIRAS